MQNSYNYTLYRKDGTTTRGTVSASSRDIAEATLTGMVKVDESVTFGELDSLNCNGYDWDKSAGAWQSRLA